MFLFIILALILLILTIFMIAVVSVGGAVCILIFGDVIVCMVLIIWIMTRIFRKK